MFPSCKKHPKYLQLKMESFPFKILFEFVTFDILKLSMDVRNRHSSLVFLYKATKSEQKFNR